MLLPIELLTETSPPAVCLPWSTSCLVIAVVVAVAAVAVVVTAVAAVAVAVVAVVAVASLCYDFSCYCSC